MTRQRPRRQSPAATSPSRVDHRVANAANASRCEQRLSTRLINLSTQPAHPIPEERQAERQAERQVNRQAERQSPSRPSVQTSSPVASPSRATERRSVSFESNRISGNASDASDCSDGEYHSMTENNFMSYWEQD